MLTKQQRRENLKQFRQELARDLQQLRHARKFSLEDLAKESGIPLYRLGKLEFSENKNIEDALQLAHFYEKKVKLVFY